ncbi:MAG: nitrate/nitrite transporter NrtS [Pseudomonadota bacterium]
MLNLINQGDALMAGADVVWWKITLTYCVPFCVATYGACCAFRTINSD